MTSFTHYDEVSRFTMKYLPLREVRGQTNSHIYVNNTSEHETMMTVSYMYGNDHDLLIHNALNYFSV